jgi:hypothetical protein
LWNAKSPRHFCCGLFVYAILVAAAGFALNLRFDRAQHQVLASLAADDRSGLFRAVA